MNDFKSIIYSALDALYVNPMTGVINEGYVQHIENKFGITRYAERYVKKYYGIESFIGEDVVSDWVRSHGKTLEKILNKKEHDKERV